MKDISLHILDIVQNSIVADAKLIEITIDEDYLNDKLTISINDNGKGIAPELLAKITDPYTTTRTTRKVGLGIPLFKQNAERTGGYLNIKSELGKGTSLVAVFIHSNIDCLTLGDITGVIILLVSGNPEIDFIYNHKKNGNLYSFNTIEVKEILGNVSVSNPTISKYLKEMIQSNLDELQIGTLGY